MCLSSGFARTDRIEIGLRSVEIVFGFGSGITLALLNAVGFFFFF